MGRQRQGHGDGGKMDESKATSNIHLDSLWNSPPQHQWEIDIVRVKEDFIEKDKDRSKDKDRAWLTKMATCSKGSIGA